MGEEAQAPTEGALRVLLAMPSRPICRRSDSHMLQALEVSQPGTVPSRGQHAQQGTGGGGSRGLLCVNVSLALAIS